MRGSWMATSADLTAEAGSKDPDAQMGGHLGKNAVSKGAPCFYWVSTSNTSAVVALTVLLVES